jgi:hypothetical protein
MGASTSRFQTRDFDGIWDLFGSQFLGGSMVFVISNGFGGDPIKNYYIQTPIVGPPILTIVSYLTTDSTSARTITVYTLSNIQRNSTTNEVIECTATPISVRAIIDQQRASLVSTAEGGGGIYQMRTVPLRLVKRPTLAEHLSGTCNHVCALRAFANIPSSQPIMTQGEWEGQVE